MSRGPGHVMRGIEAYLWRLPLDSELTYEQLARVVYSLGDVERPSRAQLSAVGRAVARLVELGKVQRQLSGLQTSDEWREPMAAGGYRNGQHVRRETVVWRTARPGAHRSGST